MATAYSATMRVWCVGTQTVRHTKDKIFVVSSHQPLLGACTYSDTLNLAKWCSASRQGDKCSLSTMAASLGVLTRRHQNVLPMW